LIIGDASMAPEELFTPRGAIEYGVDDTEPGMVWLQRIRDRFSYSVWLNPIRSIYWSERYGNRTLREIRQIYHMEDLTLGGIKNAVTYLNERG